jgi:hypothetical protein
VTTLSSTTRDRARPASWPLAPIEELDVYLDSDAEPSIIQMEVLAGGQVDPVVLQAALAAVLASDPAARRHLAAAPRWHRRLRWQAGPGWAPGLLTVASWHGEEQLAGLRETVSAWPLPLREHAVRLILGMGPDRDVVILQTHHAAFDGVASLALLTTISEAYRELLGDRPRPARPPIARTDDTNRPDVTVAPGRARGTARARRPLSRVTAWLPGAVTRIAARTACPDRAGYGAVHRVVPVPRAARRGAPPFPTVNDVLVAAVIATVDRWNAANGQRARLIRVSVPVNNRDSGGRWAGHGNQTTLIRVAAGARDRGDPARLLAHVAARTRAGKERSLGGLDAVSRLLAGGWAPAPLKRAVARFLRRVAGPVCTDTALVSNLGIIPSPPSFCGAGPESVWFLGPSQMPRGLGVSAVTMAGGLHLCVGYRHALLDREAAADFTDLYCAALAELAGS